MNTHDKVAVCSRSFSIHPSLRKELLARYENVKFNESGLVLEGNELVSFLHGYEKTITGLERFDANALSQLPELRVISKYGVGLDMLDLKSMCRQGIRLGWTSGVNRRSVSELVISFAVALLRHIQISRYEVLQGKWKQHVGGLLSERTVGIIGCGHVGKDLITLLQPWGCTILAYDILDFSNFYINNHVTPVALDELLIRSDVVSLHVPLDESTRNILSENRLKLMKATSILINTARGGLVDEVALKNMLIKERIAAAAFDVFAVEPPQDMELLSLPNFLVTPHIGGSAAEAILAMGRAAIKGLDDNYVP